MILITARTLLWRSVQVQAEMRLPFAAEIYRMYVKYAEPPLEKDR